jgi:hypothetical protein
MFDHNEHVLRPANEAAGQGLTEVSSGVHDGVTAPAVEVPAATAEDTNGTASQRHVEAGRKGAQRIHQLIQEGRLYEKEHGLKRGRQRLRQLIELGKLYEQERGLGGPRKRRDPLERMDADQLLKVLFRTLLRLTKPAYRARLLEVLQALEGGQN